jgi:hypothetical protein
VCVCHAFIARSSPCSALDWCACADVALQCWQLCCRLRVLFTIRPALLTITLAYHSLCACCAHAGAGLHKVLQGNDLLGYAVPNALYILCPLSSAFDCNTTGITTRYTGRCLYSGVANEILCRQQTCWQRADRCSCWFEKDAALVALDVVSVVADCAITHAWQLTARARVRLGVCMQAVFCSARWPLRLLHMICS